MRVNFPFTGEHGTDSPYWMGAATMSSRRSPADGGAQHVEVNWADVGGPFYLTQQTPAGRPPPYPFDATKVQAIQFQVFTNATAATPYSFCVANLALITEVAVTEARARSRGRKQKPPAVRPQVAFLFRDAAPTRSGAGGQTSQSTMTVAPGLA